MATNITSRCSSHTSCAGQFLSRGVVVLLRKSIPQNHNLKTAAELGVRHHLLGEVIQMIRIFFCCIAWAIISGCQSTTDVEASLIGKEQKCSRDCSSYYKICDNEMSATPIAHHNGCVETFRYCAQSCPSAGSQPTETKSSVTEKLKELESLRKQGLINEPEYQNKKQEILKAM